MKRLFFAALVAGVSGCQSQQATPVPVVAGGSDDRTFCQKATEFLRHPYANDWQKAAVYEKMRNRGCLI